MLLLPTRRSCGRSGRTTSFLKGRGSRTAIRSTVPGRIDALADASVQRSEVIEPLWKMEEKCFFSVRGWEGNGARGIRFDKIMVFEEYRSFDKFQQLRHAVGSGTLTLRVAEVLPASLLAWRWIGSKRSGPRGRTLC